MARKDREHDLKGMLAEATEALSHLDAERLEEMALSCEALVDGEIAGPLPSGEPQNRDANDMAIFVRVLEATKANLNVMRRLHQARMAGLQRDPAGMDEYGDH